MRQETEKESAGKRTLGLMEAGEALPRQLILRGSPEGPACAARLLTPPA